MNESQPTAAASVSRRPVWPWIAGGCGCLSLIGIIVVILIVVLASGNKSKLVGRWKNAATIESFNRDGSLRIEAHGQDNDGKDLKMSISGRYREQSGTLFMTLREMHIDTPGKAKLLEAQMKQQLAAQLKFGQEQSAKLRWLDKDSFQMTSEAGETTEWNRQ
jgi:hypothetical protein